MPNKSPINLITSIPLFADLNQRDLEFFVQHTRFDRFERDAVIFYQGDATDRVWVVNTGRVKIVYHDLDGREVILELISPGEAFGGAVLFFPEHPATAIALEDSEIASFPREIYSQFLLSQPVVMLKLLQMLGKRQLSMMNMQILAGERVELRMAHILLKFADRLGRPDPDGVMITLPLSRQDLADLAGTTLESAIRTISRFNKNGLVETRRGGYLVIKDINALTMITTKGLSGFE